jgi:hypothetical protein
MSDQDCCCSHKVLRTADLSAMIQCVTWRWGNTTQAGIDARRAETVLCCDYYCHYCTIISLIGTIICIIAEKEFANRPGIHWKNEVKSIWHHARLVLVANGSRFDSVWKHQRALPHGWAGSRGCVVRVGLTESQPARMAGRNWSPKSSTVLAIAALLSCHTWSASPRSWRTCNNAYN